MNYKEAILKLNAGNPAFILYEQLKKEYAGQGVKIFESNYHWMFSLDDFYPLKDSQETWNLFSKKGYLEGLKMLKKHCYDCYPALCVQWAGLYGHIDCLQWFLDNYGPDCFDHSMVNLVIEGLPDCLYVIKWLHENIGGNLLEYATDAASMYYAMDVLQYLCQFPQYMNYDANELILNAICSGNIIMCKWIVDKFGINIIDENCIWEAVCIGDIDILEFIMKSKPLSVFPDMDELEVINFETFDSLQCMNYLRNQGY